MNSRDALQLAESRRAELVELLMELLAAPSPRGTSALAAQRIVEHFLAARGFDIDLTEDDPEAARDHAEYMPVPQSPEKPVNLIARPQTGSDSGVVFFAHVDTEPAQSQLAPFARDGRLFGLGAADDKGGLAAACLAATLLARGGAGAPLVASVHGKQGGARGTLPVFSRLGRHEVAVYVHPPETGEGLEVLKNASRGVLDVVLRITGWQGRAREVGTPASAPFDEAGDALQTCLSLVNALKEGVLADCEVNLGRVEAGESAAVVPHHCRAEIRVLFQGERTAREVLSAIAQAAAKTCRFSSRPAGSFRYELEHAGMRASPAVAPWDGPACSALRAAVREVTGHEPRPYGRHLASDIRFPILISGTPSIGVGSRAGNFYGPNEWVDIDDLVNLVALLVVFASRWGSAGS